MASEQSSADYEGYNYSFVDKNLDRFTCNVCTNVLKDPHLTGCCGQEFCESCLKNWFAKHCKKSCPHCRAEGKEFQHLIDKRLKREIDSLRIYCTNKEEGCQWIGELESLKDHLESENGCDYVEVECPNKCMKVAIFPTKLKRKHTKNHLKKDCPHRPHQCEHCGLKGTYVTITGDRNGYFCLIGQVAHYDKCPGFPLECPNKCGVKDIKRKDMKDHRSQCSEEPVQCPKKCHCWLKRKDLDKHFTDACRHRPYQCEHCSKKDIYIEITTKHYNSCPKFPLECPNKCGRKNIERKDMKNHRIQCSEEPVICPFEEAGCKEKLVRRELEQHMSSAQQQHLLMVMGAYKEMKRENEKMKRELKKENKQRKKESVDMKKKIAELEEKVLFFQSHREEHIETKPSTMNKDVSNQQYQQENLIKEDKIDMGIEPGTPGGLTAKAIFDYQASGDNEITFDFDDTIENIEQVDPGWWIGDCNGKRGLFPANYVEII